MTRRWIVWLSWLLLGCGAHGHDAHGLMVSVESGHMDAGRRVAFEAELAEATRRFDYRRVDPEQVAHGRMLMPTRLEGCYFTRYLIDGREHAPGMHPALAPGRSAGPSWKIPYYYDPEERFAVARRIFKVDGQWEVIAEDWVLFPANSKQRQTLLAMVQTSEVSGGSDVLPGVTGERGIPGRCGDLSLGLRRDV